jgi:flavorubredoxin
MMPFRGVIRKNIEKIQPLPAAMIAPSHGPIYDKPAFIVDAYRDWTSDEAKNEVVVPYVSMHGSTRRMVGHLVSGLCRRGVTVMQFDLSATDIGKVAIALVDASTIVIGTPTVHAGPHPAVAYAAQLTNMLRPKLRYASIIGSFGWGGKAIENIVSFLPNLKLEVLPPVLCKGLPRGQDFAALDSLADAIAARHEGLIKK